MISSLSTGLNSARGFIPKPGSSNGSDVMQIKSGLIKVSAVVVLFALLIASSLSSSTQRVGALQATQAATMPAVPASASLPPSMAVALVPCASGVTGPCDLIATKAEDIVGVWKQYLGG